MALKELVPLTLQPYTLHTLFHTDRLAQRHRRHRLNHFLFVHGSRHPSGFGPGGVDVAGIPGFRCPHVLHVVRHKFHMISQDGDQSFLLHTHTAHHSSMSCLNCFVRQILPLAIPKWLVGGFAGALAVRLCCLATSSAEYESQLAQI